MEIDPDPATRRSSSLIERRFMSTDPGGSGRGARAFRSTPLIGEAQPEAMVEAAAESNARRTWAEEN
jgi:hypothetical protein